MFDDVLNNLQNAVSEMLNQALSEALQNDDIAAMTANAQELISKAELMTTVIIVLLSVNTVMLGFIIYKLIRRDIKEKQNG